MHLADAFIQSTFGLYIFCQYVCSLGIEPSTFVLLTQCSTTEPQEHTVRDQISVLKYTQSSPNVYRVD